MSTVTHSFQNPSEDTAEFCTCGAGFWDGYHRQAMKIAHLNAFLPEEEVAAQIVANMTPGQLADVATGITRPAMNAPHLDLAVWNAAIDRENGYVS